jgi:hypothetical protein
MPPILPGDARCFRAAFDMDASFARKR